MTSAGGPIWHDFSYRNPLDDQNPWIQPGISSTLSRFSEESYDFGEDDDAGIRPQRRRTSSSSSAVVQSLPCASAAVQVLNQTPNSAISGDHRGETPLRKDSQGATRGVTSGVKNFGVVNKLSFISFRRGDKSSSSNSPSPVESNTNTIANNSGDESRFRFRTVFLGHSPSNNAASTKDKDKTKNKATSAATANGDGDHADKMKTKLLSMWNNVKHGWTMKLKTNFSKDSAIWLLGRCYHQKLEMCPNPETSPDLELMFNLFRDDFFSRIWLTYRREFPTLAGSSLTTDCGWGCMLRSGQMMLAGALAHHFLGRDWRWNAQQTPELEKLHRKIIRWFGDMNNDSSPFSLHHLVAIGESTGKKAGDWYGPASVAHILKQALENGRTSQPLLDTLCIYVAQDCTVYKGDVMEMCKGPPLTTEAGELPNWKGVIILIPVRLGGEAFNSVYTHCIKHLLADSCCLGIIGGRPKHSLYFVGWQDDKLIHLDPHYCQEMVDVYKEDFPVETFHCPSPRKMSFSRMDPSCTIGFYCRSEKEFNSVASLSRQVVLQHSEHGDYPVFVVADGKSKDHDMPLRAQMAADAERYWSNRTSISVSEADSEEFVFL